MAITYPRREPMRTTFLLTQADTAADSWGTAPASGADTMSSLALEVKYHDQVIQAVQNDLVPAMQNAELRTLVETVVPAFQAHHRAAQNLQTTLGG